VLEKLLLKGSIVVKKAYCDWDRYKAFKAPMHEANFELIEIPHVRQSGKNSADIRMVVDALDLCYTKAHVDTFVIISGDSDFSPLVSKLRENAKLVIGVGVKNSTSDLLIANCDEFIYYDDLVREEKKRVAKRVAKGTTKAAAKPAAMLPEAPAEAPPLAAPTAEAASPTKSRKRTSKQAATEPAPASRRRRASKKTSAEPVEEGTAGIATTEPGEGAPTRVEGEKIQEALELIVGTVEALAEERGGDDKVWGSMVKQAIKRVKPGFNESYYGFRSFNALLEEAQTRGLLTLERDEKSGGYALSVTGRD
jgi:fructose-specific phosphotransferase system component IIB